MGKLLSRREEERVKTFSPMILEMSFIFRGNLHTSNLVGDEVHIIVVELDAPQRIEHELILPVAVVAGTSGPSDDGEAQGVIRVYLKLYGKRALSMSAATPGGPDARKSVEGSHEIPALRVNLGPLFLEMCWYRELHSLGLHRGLESHQGLLDPVILSRQLFPRLTELLRQGVHEPLFLVALVLLQSNVVEVIY